MSGLLFLILRGCLGDANRMTIQDSPLPGATIRRMRRKLKWAAIVLCIVVASSVLFLRYWAPLGGAISGERLERAQASSHYHAGEFENTLPHPPLEFGDVWSYIKEQLFGDQIRTPPSAIPMPSVLPVLLEAQPASELRAIWFGHSSVYMELDGLRFFVDPVFSDYASPISGIGPKRSHPPPIALTNLPRIDVVMISHDHYDHLDMQTIQYLSSNGSRFLVPLGVGAHLDEWNVPKTQITELDWWESTNIGGVTITSTPAQHYSGRGLFDYKETFWSSWAVVGTKHRVFYSGDSGLSDHFRSIGEQYGPFDLSIIKIGQYGPGASWVYSHMDPEQAIEAHIAVRASRMLPVSWATFNIAFHDWDEPIRRAAQAASEKNVELVTPRVGDIVVAGKPFNSHSWWEEVE